MSPFYWGLVAGLALGFLLGVFATIATASKAVRLW